ncbi:hypothetical protein [Streptomyces sp. DASNCL29]|uniref:hypothetical protein n=1 Tax=Streptomyces sp. DASNCL29 TaxID=2583819 RepID=UPI00110F817A|nr:hypothetical protein [Streptomyces sp. DASNCL29]TMU99963.1 hypothetical protein FGK60_21305 [Streptomyces sp. DASNCL29]
MRLAWDRYRENMEQARETLLQQRTEPRAHLRPQEVNPYTHQVCARFPKSIRLGQQEKQVPLIIDQLYSCLRWTGRSAVSVYTHEANGRGDLMLGVKAAQALRLVFSTEGSSAADVALLTAAKAHAKLPELFDGCGLPYVILPGSDSNPKRGRYSPRTARRNTCWSHRNWRRPRRCRPASSRRGDAGRWR